MHKTFYVLAIIFILFSITILAQSRVFIASGLKAWESRASFFVSIEPSFKFWQLSAAFNLNLILNPMEKLLSLEVFEKRLDEIFENAEFELWDLNYRFSSSKMKIVESSLVPLESNLNGKISTYSIKHSDFFQVSLEDQQNFLLFDSNIKYPVFSLNIRGTLHKNTDEFNFEIAPQVPVSFLMITPFLRFSNNSFQSGGGFISFPSDNFKGFIGFNFSPTNETTNELGFSNVKSKSLLNFGFEGTHTGFYIGISEKSLSLCGSMDFNSENLKIYIEPSLIANREKDIKVNFSLFSKLEFSITEKWQLKMDFKISPDDSTISLGTLYKMYDEKEEKNEDATSKR